MLERRIVQHVGCNGRYVPFHGTDSDIDSPSSICLRSARSFWLARRIMNDMTGAMSAENPEGRPRLRRLKRRMVLFYAAKFLKNCLTEMSRRMRLRLRSKTFQSCISSGPRSVLAGIRPERLGLARPLAR